MSLVIRPCADRHPNPSDTYADCLFCWKHEARPKWRFAYMGSLEGLRPWLRPPAGASRALGLKQTGPLPCIHLGEPTGELVECAACGVPGGRVQIKLRACNLHGTCTEGKKLDGRACCRGCPDRKETLPMPVEWISTARLAADSIKLAAMLPADLTAIAGVPRSGMIPAAIVAAHRHLPLWQLTEGGELGPLGTGGRAKDLDGSTGRIAVIDDTVYFGSAMRRARRGVNGREAVFAAVYVRADAPAVVDLHVRALGDVHLLSWNFCNSGPFVGHSKSPVYGDGIGLDLDGVIVTDRECGGPVGLPYNVPRKYPCKLIATGRRERHRAETEAMLRAIGARWERLEMLPDNDPGTNQSIAIHKATHYSASGLGFFVESDPVQAETIFRLSKRPVICPILDRVFSEHDSTSALG